MNSSEAQGSSLRLLCHVQQRHPPHGSRWLLELKPSNLHSSAGKRNGKEGYSPSLEVAHTLWLIPTGHTKLQGKPSHVIVFLGSHMSAEKLGVLLLRKRQRINIGRQLEVCGTGSGWIPSAGAGRPSAGKGPGCPLLTLSLGHSSAKRVSGSPRVSSSDKRLHLTEKWRWIQRNAGVFA